MNKVLTLSVFICFNVVLLLTMLLYTTPSLSGAQVETKTDKEIYTMIMEVVDSTPHTDLIMDAVPESGTTRTTIRTADPKFLNELTQKRLLEYCSQLDGNVTVVVEYSSDLGGTVITVTQILDA